MTEREMKLILLAGMGENAAELISGTKSPCRRLILPHDTAGASELLLGELKKHDIRVVVLIGEKPRIRGRIAVEPTAVRDGEALRTPLDCYGTARTLRMCGAKAYISRGCKASPCSAVYYECLRAWVNCVMLSVPTAENASDMKAMIQGVDGLIERLDGIPCLL